MGDSASTEFTKFAPTCAQDCKVPDYTGNTDLTVTDAQGLTVAKDTEVNSGTVLTLACSMEGTSMKSMNPKGVTSATCEDGTLKLNNDLGTFTDMTPKCDGD